MSRGLRYPELRVPYVPMHRPFRRLPRLCIEHLASPLTRSTPQECYRDSVDANHQQFSRDLLEVRVFPDETAAGAAGAEIAGGIIRAEMEQSGKGGSGSSPPLCRRTFLSAALRAQAIDWTRLTALGSGQIAGMSADHPASFRRFLRDRLFDHVPVAAFHQLDGEAADPAAEVRTLRQTMRQASAW